VELETRIRGIEKIFIIVEDLEEKKMNIGMFYLTVEADIWWNTVKDRLLGPNLTWNRFLEELRAKFYLVVVQR